MTGIVPGLTYPQRTHRLEAICRAYATAGVIVTPIETYGLAIRPSSPLAS
jgi:hypothetical protein